MVATQPAEALARPAARNLSDQTGALTVLLFFIFAIPSNLIVPALGSAGTPAQIVGLLLLAAWGVSTVAFRLHRQRHALRWAMLAFFGATLASYIAASMRPIEPVELRAADRGLITVLAWLGMTFAAMDGLASKDSLNRFMRRMTLAASLVAALGLLQFATGEAFTNYLQLPGLSVNSDAGLLTRGSFNRPTGTTIHPIEFGAVLTMVLPFALHYALHDTHRHWLRRWLPVALIALAIPVSISRSAIVSSVVVLLVLLPSWTPSLRRRAYAAIATLAVAVYLLVPGLLGTITGLFTGISNDSSAKSRTDSYSLALDFIRRAPLFGRGFKTFLPSYRILDNQYLGLAIEMGVVGVVALLGLVICSLVTSLRLRRSLTEPTDRHLALAFVAAVASNAVSLALYDGFGFSMASCVFFLILGCSAALRQLSAAAPADPRPAVSLG